jgi:hypothetical protein
MDRLGPRCGCCGQPLDPPLDFLARVVMRGAATWLWTLPCRICEAFARLRALRDGGPW